MHWLTDLLSGPIATFLATLAIAFLGFQLLSGRMAVRRGALVIFGCMVLFGSGVVAQSLMDLARGPAIAPLPAPATAAVPAPEQPEPRATSRPASNPFDPYGGGNPTD